MTNSDSQLTLAQRLLGLALGLGLMLSFAVVIVAAGHGVAPLGVLMVLGSLAGWGLPMALGWAAVAALAAAPFVRASKWHLVVGAAAGGALLLSWWCFVSESRDLRFTLATSLPFGVVLLLYVLRLCYLAARRGGRAV